MSTLHNMPPVVTCDNCGLHYYQTSAPHVCAGWAMKEKVMSTTIEKPCGDCFNKSHTHQIVDYPVGARVEAVIDIPTSQGVIRAGTRGTVSSHCDDGRAYVSFDSGDAGHTFHQPEAYIHVIDRSEGDWCDDCHGYTHMPWCPEYRAVNEINDEEYRQERFQNASKGAICKSHGLAVLVTHVNDGEPCADYLSNEHEPVARGGEGECDEWRVFNFARDGANEWMVTTTTGRTVALANTSDPRLAESEMRQIATEHNQHHSLLAERERYTRLFEAVKGFRLRHREQAKSLKFNDCGCNDCLLFQSIINAIDQKGE